VLTPPAALDHQALVAALSDGWRIEAATLDYEPVGWGSHHWTATARDGAAWFVTVDELAGRRQSADEPLADAGTRLEAALASASALRGAGRGFVVAPVPARDGQLVGRVGNFAVAVYPHAGGDGFDFGHRPDAEHAAALLEMVTAVHSAGARVRDLAPVDDFTIPHRDQVDSALAGGAGTGAAGPYALRAARLVMAHAPAIRRALDHYDGLVASARAGRDRDVLTHGEPHPGNTMRTGSGWVLIDWDTARVAPPERDLWLLLDAVDEPVRSTLAATYTASTGSTLRGHHLAPYRRRWDRGEVGVAVARFRRPHAGTPEDAKAFELLGAQLAGLDAPAAPGD
jgi:spectinomycin phosphotransferase/16S rRNA (guanine(1405)-N(7))-methyltransferase